MTKIVLSIFIILNFYLEAKSINVAVAANVSYAMDSLLKEFHTLYPNSKVKITIGSSGKLTAQIKNGAPYDLFLSANMKYPQALYDEAKAITKPVVYAKGGLVLLSTKHRTFVKGIDTVKSMLVKRIAIANPTTAPYGKATLEALKKSKNYEAIEHKIIYGESISQTVSYTLLGADLGFIAKSSLYSPKMKRFAKDAYWIDVDSSLYTPIKQGIVLLQKGKNNQDAKNFYQFMLSVKAQSILKDFGYLIDE
jgi:molybdate transport system substrate-binding protein